MTAPGTGRWLSVAAAVVLGLALSGPAAASDAAGTGAPLGRGAGFDRALGSDRVRSVQRRLRGLGDAPGPIDGRFGPLTEAAVRRAQRARGLVGDGIVGRRTAEALRARVPLAPGTGWGLPQGSDRVRSLQRQLRALGTRPGPIDGRFGRLTQAAVQRVQRAEGLADDGIVGPRTARRLARLKTPTPAPRPRATQPRPTPHSPPAFRGAHSRQTHLGAGNPANPVLIVLLAAIALALLFAGGLTWRRRRRVAPTAPPGPTAVDHRPKPASTGLPVPQITLARGRQATLAGHPAPAPSKGFAALAQPITDNGTARRATPGPSSHSAERAAPTVRAFGYISVPSDSPLGSAAGRQSRAIEAACAARGWTFVGGVREPAPAIAGDRTRPGLEHVLERFQRGEANCLVVADLRRLTSSAVELGGLLDRLWGSGVRLLVLDLGIDTGTESGQLAAGALIRVGGWEHERVTDRTGNGLTAAPSTGTAARPTSA